MTPSIPNRAAVPPSRKLRSLVLRPEVLRLFGYGLVIALWFYASGGLLSEHVLPNPLTIGETIVELIASGAFIDHAIPTLVKIAIGFSLSFILGAAVGVLMRSPVITALLQDWVVAMMSTPGLVFVLVAALVFGFHPAGPIVATVVTAFPFVTTNVSEGVKALPRDLYEMGSVFELNRRSVLRNITLPFVTPFLLTGARYAFSISWKTVTLSELFGSSRGIGFMMRLEYRSFNVAGLLAWVVTFFVIALLLEALIAYFERRALAWRADGAKGSA